MNFSVVILAFLGLLLSTSAVKVTYENFKVYNVVPKSVEQVQILTDLKKEVGYEFWNKIFNIGSNVRIMVHPDYDSQFVNYTKSVNVESNVTIENLQKLIDAQMIPSANTGRTSGSFSWDRYHNLDAIYAWLDELAELFPNVVTTVVMGNSNEGREIKGVVIDFKPNERGENPLSGMIEGGIHAREWISPATVTWIINEFLTSSDPDVRFMAETFVWHIFPVTNPDGYVYTFTDNRMWRKNRNTAYATTCCISNDHSNGIDLNRNFDFVWMTVGASSNPCDETFAGPSGSSEPEARAISNYVLNLKERSNLIFYYSFHSYTQMILIPYSHVSGFDKLQAANYADLYEIAIRGVEKLTSVHGTPYIVETSGDIQFSGSSFDWVKGVADVPIVYLIELRDTGVYGNLLPTEQIIPNNEEIMACLVEMDKVTRHLGYYSSGTTAIFGSFAILLSAIGFLVCSQQKGTFKYVSF